MKWLSQTTKHNKTIAETNSGKHLLFNYSTVIDQQIIQAIEQQIINAKEHTQTLSRFMQDDLW